MENNRGVNFEFFDDKFAVMYDATDMAHCNKTFTYNEVERIIRHPRGIVMILRDGNEISVPCDRSNHEWREWVIEKIFQGQGRNGGVNLKAH
ncbi:hypothetical protein CQA49_06685 [Helicobacter sp. MIT 00-7814]|uniref:hypothetical protein n=1 Tax=unclassified Helicobacter TaxID=2593540 RepID=UPI000E1F0148|nr:MULTISPECIES: hypothetical protein [unclassified Helicobacter]RDU53329.1 hypothetical protein CQA49_06685 [Helicobacter sp. MIT 00-7814]RDU54150.1 hypothetical protein CQA37_05925 [Helicobacter sp. MIT 99-10781]